MHFTFILKSLMHNFSLQTFILESFEVIADSDLLLVFIYTELFFICTGQWLNADFFMDIAK